MRLVSDICHSEVGERALQPNVRQSGDVTRECRRFFAHAADAPHARVDGEVQLRRLFLREGFGGNGFGEREIRDGLRHIEGDSFGGFQRVDESEDEERRPNPCAAKLGGFRERGDGEVRRTRRDSLLRDSESAVPVSVRLDDGAEFCTATERLADHAVIVPDRAEVDFSPYGTLAHGKAPFALMVVPFPHGFSMTSTPPM